MNRRSARRASSRLSCLLVVALSIGGVGATPTVSIAATPSAADKETARTLFNEAKALREAGQLGDALEKYRQAHVLGRTPITGLELGRTHMMAGDLLEAREVLLSVGRLEAKPDESPKSQAARVQAASLAEELKQRIPAVQLVLHNIPSGAHVLLAIDDVKVAVPALIVPRKLNPGLHRVEVRVDNEAPVVTVFSLVEGETKIVTIELPVEDSPRSVQQEPSVPPARTEAPRRADAPSPGREIGWLEWAQIPALTIGGVALTTGIVTGLIAIQSSSQLHSACPNDLCPASQSQKLDEARTFALVSTISFAVGAAGLGLGMWGLFTSANRAAVPERRAGPAAPRWTASVSPVAVVVGGRF